MPAFAPVERPPEESEDVSFASGVSVDVEEAVAVAVDEGDTDVVVDVLVLVVYRLSSADRWMTVSGCAHNWIVPEAVVLEV
jgi:hypothetical protein